MVKDFKKHPWSYNLEGLGTVWYSTPKKNEDDLPPALTLMRLGYFIPLILRRTFLKYESFFLSYLKFLAHN